MKTTLLILCVSVTIALAHQQERDKRAEEWASGIRFGKRGPALSQEAWWNKAFRFGKRSDDGGEKRWTNEIRFGKRDPSSALDMHFGFGKRDWASAVRLG